MRSNELTLKILNISLKNSLVMGFLAKVNSTCLHVYMYAFVNTSVMVAHPNVALCGTSRRVMDYPDPAHSSWAYLFSLLPWTSSA